MTGETSCASIKWKNNLEGTKMFSPDDKGELGVLQEWHGGPGVSHWVRSRRLADEVTEHRGLCTLGGVVKGGTENDFVLWKTSRDAVLKTAHNGHS